VLIRAVPYLYKKPPAWQSNTVDKTTLEALEYPEVLKELSAYSVTPIGADLIGALAPLADADSIEEAYAELRELTALINSSGRLPLAGVADLRPLLSRAVPVGAYYLPDELQLIGATLIALFRLKSVLDAGMKRRYPRLSVRFEAFSNQGALSEEIGRILDDKGHIADDASVELKRIRREIISVRGRARSILDSLLKDKSTADLLQEELVTIREDRYVLMVKAERHRELGGVVHGRSATGQTYFIEPFSLVEINNTLAILKKDEGAEEIRILKAVTALVVEGRDLILSDLVAAGHLDTLAARALFADDIKGIIPALKSAGSVKLVKARHPLLALKELRGGVEAVPVDIIIDEGCRVLVISGANTGGKTVALKTLGLLTLMALSAIPIPAGDGAEVVIFESIFADIGDRQDIIESLSTFSAHIKRINGFFDGAGPGSLVLIDEIGVGTDPVEGAALALAVLETFKERGALSVVTTHLNLLKAHGQADPGYENASVAFDEGSLKPLYNLSYGVPGQSLGLSIARSLGMDAELIGRARGYIDVDEGAFVESVKALEDKREELDGIVRSTKALEEKRAELVDGLRDKRGVFLEKAKVRLDGLVNEAAREIKEVMKEFKAQKSAAPTSKVIEKIKEIEAKAIGGLGRSESYVPVVGAHVKIKGSSSTGVVLSVNPSEGKAELMVGSLKVWVDTKKLSQGSAKPRSKPQGVNINADIEVATRINIVGKRVPEAIKLLTRFMDNAYANGLESVEVVHGVGTGRLASAVKDFMAECAFVKSFRHGDSALGGGGVTLVELA
jgi:DNA mismatch repair protein MutS2